MKKILLSNTMGAVLLIVGLAGFTQSVNPSFWASADTAQISTLSSATMLAVIGAIFFILGLLIIILKIMKGHTRNG
jgi:uncharacterized membrane protein